MSQSNDNSTEQNVSEGQAASVLVLDESFYIPQLDRYRRVWIYLPEGYTTSEIRYPVFYMHDGQNLFDNDTALAEEWYLDEILTVMNAQCIIVGIDNGEEKRLTEYNVRDHTEHGDGEGKKYLDFIVQTLKPFIDEKYRTLPDREHTFIAGSSMGGLITFYGAMYFPETFGGAGIFSPAFWLVPDLLDEMKLVAGQHPEYPQHLYFYGAKQEDEKMLELIRQITELLAQYPHYKIYLDLHEEGEHNEVYWGARFGEYYLWSQVNAEAG